MPRKHGLGPLNALEIKPPIIGNRRDGKRGVGWEALHVAIDDASRLA